MQLEPQPEAAMLPAAAPSSGQGKQTQHKVGNAVTALPGVSSHLLTIHALRLF